MIHVPHDGDDRRARFEVLDLVLLVQFDLFDRRMNDTATALALFHLKPKTVFRANLLRDVLVNGLIDVGHDLQLDEVGNELEGFLIQLFSQFPNRNGRLDGNDFGGCR